MMFEVPLFDDSNVNVFDNCRRSNLNYTGADPKIPIIYNNEEWFLKLRREYSGILLNNHLSEYIGSNVFKILGLESQECILGRYQGNDVVAIKNFATESDTTLKEFADTNESSFDSDLNSEITDNYYSFETIIEHINHYNKQVAPKELEKYFWDLFVIDAILGNFDRHGHNWGLIKNGKDTVKIAPIYDNGACLFSRLSDEDISNIIYNQEELRKRVYDVPKAKLLLNGKRVSYEKLIDANLYTGLNESIKLIANKVNNGNLMKKIFKMIQDIPDELCSEVRKRFYKTIIYLRYKCLIENIDFEVAYRSLKEVIS